MNFLGYGGQKRMAQYRHKYGAVKVKRDGHTFDSKKEGKRYDELILLKDAGEVIWFMLQPPFYFPSSKYVADFMVFWADGTCTVEDVKGFMTPKFKADMKRMAIYYPMVNVEVI
jgi:hypothetical protein